MPSSEASAGGPGLDIVLYVSPGSASSAKARRNLDTILESYDPSTFHLTVRDVSRDLRDAEADHIVFTPTLTSAIRKRPARWSAIWRTEAPSRWC